MLRAFVVVILLAAAPAARGADVPVDLELVLAADVSRSIDDVEHALQREGYAEALTSREVLRAIRGGVLGAIAVTFVEWAGVDEADVVAGWMVIRDAASAVRFAQVLRDTPRLVRGSTSISGAIDRAATLFDNNGIEGTRRAIDVSGDGINVSGRPVEEARDEAVARRITINGLPIVNDRPSRPPWPEPPIDQYYRDHVIGGPGAFFVVAKDFASFGEAVRRKLVREIVGLPAGGDVRTAETGQER
jgi:hypothetical protein